jgi:hypothetical protein
MKLSLDEQAGHAAGSRLHLEGRVSGVLLSLAEEVTEHTPPSRNVLVAAESLAQVHRATLPDGTAVDVKVQRCDLERLVDRDPDAITLGLRLLYRLAPRRVQRMNLLNFF